MKPGKFDAETIAKNIRPLQIPNEIEEKPVPFTQKSKNALIAESMFISALRKLEDR